MPGNINIHESNGAYTANNFAVPAGASSVSFHASAACTVCFTNNATFNMNSLTLAKGGNPTPVTVASRVATDYGVYASGYNCPAGDRPKLTDAVTYTITMDSMGK